MSQEKSFNPQSEAKAPFFDIVSLIILGVFGVFALIALFTFWEDYQRNKLAGELRPYRVEKDFVSAIPYLEKALDQNPKNSTYLKELIEGYVKNDQPELALKTIETARERLSKFDAQPWQIIVDFELNPGKETGDKLVAAMQKSPEDPALAYYSAKYFASEGEYQDSGVLLMRVAKDKFWNEKAEGLRKELTQAVYGGVS